MRRPVLALLLVVSLLLPVLFMGAFIAIAGEEIGPSERALEEIPPALLPLYQAAAGTCEGLDWTILAAIHKIETNFGTGRAVSSAGAQGPMQFMPATWNAYGVDADGDGVADVNNVSDAIFSAVRLLCANGAGDPARLADAIWNYNHSDQYVADVLELAHSYGLVGFGGGGALAASPKAVLSNPRILLTSNARADVEAGIVDPRVLALLQAVSRRHSLGVSVFKTGHSKYTRSGSVSNHYYGRAVDIFFVDGEPVSSSNEAARDLVTLISRFDRDLRPTELGHPFPDLRFSGGFSDTDHADHLHLAYDD